MFKFVILTGVFPVAVIILYLLCVKYFCGQCSFYEEFCVVIFHIKKRNVNEYDRIVSAVLTLLTPYCIFAENDV